MTKIILDFDGVMFESAKERYLIANMLAEVNGKNKIVSFETFLDFRKKVTSAWHYAELYLHEDEKQEFINSIELKNNYVEAFKNIRKKLIGSHDWVQCFSPYNFFKEIREDIIN